MSPTVIWGKWTSTCCEGSRGQRVAPSRGPTGQSYLGSVDGLSTEVLVHLLRRDALVVQIALDGEAIGLARDRLEEGGATTKSGEQDGVSDVVARS